MDLERLSRRFDPPEREEAHRAELRARTRRRNETADEFAEHLKNLAQRAYPLADQRMLDNMVVERFREGHNSAELKRHLCLYPSTGLQDLIGACVRFETHIDGNARPQKSNEGVYQVTDTNAQSYEEVQRAARALGYSLRPWVTRQQDSRPFRRDDRQSDRPFIRQNQGQTPQRSPRPSPANQSSRTPDRRQPPPREEVKCWTCGVVGHYASECSQSGPKFAFAPKAVRMNYLQEINESLDYSQDYTQEINEGND